MAKDKPYRIVLGGGVEANGNAELQNLLALGGPYAIAQVLKNGNNWVTNITLHHTMTAEEFAVFAKASNDALKGKKWDDDLDIHELLKKYKEGAAIVIGFGEQAAKGK